MNKVLLDTKININEIKDRLKINKTIHFDRKQVYSFIINDILQNSYKKSFLDDESNANKSQINFIITEDDINLENLNHIECIKSIYPSHKNLDNKPTDIFCNNKKLIEFIVDNCNNLETSKNINDYYELYISIIFDFYIWVFEFSNGIMFSSTNTINIDSNNIITHNLLKQLHYKLFPTLIVMTFQDIRNSIQSIFKNKIKNLKINFHQEYNKNIKKILKQNIKLFKIIDYLQDNIFEINQKNVEFKINVIELKTIDELCDNDNDKINIITDSIYYNLLLH